MIQSFRRSGAFGALVGLVLLAGGCSHYQLGTGGGRLAFTTLYIQPVENRARIPQSQAIVSTALREAFLQDGRVELVGSSQAADATLTVVLTEYHRDVAAVREVDTGLASKFALTLVSECTLRDNRSGRMLFEKRIVRVQRDAFTDNGAPASSAVGDQLQSEYNTLPVLAGALADRVTHAVLDVW
jgi:hypothetical protein